MSTIVRECDGFLNTYFAKIYKLLKQKALRVAGKKNKIKRLEFRWTKSKKNKITKIMFRTKSYNGTEFT